MMVRSSPNAARSALTLSMSPRSGSPRPPDIRPDLRPVLSAPAEQPVDGHAQFLAHDVVTGGVDTGNAGDAGGARLGHPGEHPLPQARDVERVLADDQRPQAGLDHLCDD